MQETKSNIYMSFFDGPTDIVESTFTYYYNIYLATFENVAALVYNHENTKIDLVLLSKSRFL